MNRTERALAIGLETLGSCIILTGMIIEIGLHAQLGYILITGGAWITSVGGLLWSKVIRK